MMFNADYLFQDKTTKILIINEYKKIFDRDYNLGKQSAFLVENNKLSFIGRNTHIEKKLTSSNNQLFMIISQIFIIGLGIGLILFSTISELLLIISFSILSMSTFLTSNNSHKTYFLDKIEIEEFSIEDYNIVKNYAPDSLYDWINALRDYHYRDSQVAREVACIILNKAKNKHLNTIKEKESIIDYSWLPIKNEEEKLV